MYDQNLQTITLIAAEDITAYTAVTVNSSGLAAVAPLAGTSVAIVGVAQNDAAAGEAVTVAYAGVTKALASSVGITAGQIVRVGTVNGEMEDIGAATTVVKLGLALASAASGKYGAVLLGGSKPIS